MAIGKHKFTKVNRALDKKRAKVAQEFPGLLGINFGTGNVVEVPGRDGYYYVRIRGNFSEYVVAYNAGGIAPVYNLPVVIFRDKTDKSKWWIKSRDYGAYNNWGNSIYVGKHGAQHSFNPDGVGADITWIYDKQFMPLAAIPSGSSGANNLIMQPYSFWDETIDRWTHAGATGTPAFAPHNPTGTNQARSVLLFMDNWGNPQITGSSLYYADTVTGTSAVIGYAPAPVYNTYPIAVVRLISGSSAIGWDNIYPIREYYSTYDETSFWDDIRVPVTSTKVGGASDPDFTVFKTNGAGSQGVFIYWFSNILEEELYFTLQFPHGWKEGTDIEPHVHWTPSTNGTGTVSWGMEFTWANIGASFPNTSLIYGNITYNKVEGNLVAGDHYLTELPTITGTSKTISSMLVGRIFRDATEAGLPDSYNQDAGLLEIDFHIQKDALGTVTEYV